MSTTIRAMRAAVVSLALLAAPCLAQADSARACTAPPATGVGEHVLQLAARPVADGRVVRKAVRGADRARLMQLLNDVGADLRVPPALSFVDGPGVWYVAAEGVHRDTLVRPIVRPSLSLTLHAGRDATGLTLDGSPVPELDSALVQAVRAAQARGLGWVLAPGEVRGDSLTVVLELAAGPDTVGVTAPVARVILPQFLATPVSIRPDSRVVAPYPESARQANREGSVLVSFVVTESGTADLGSVEVHRGEPEFVTSVMIALSRTRYTPAMVGGCPVRMVVAQPFEFRLQGGPHEGPPPPRDPGSRRWP
jgi:TonB family protein